ncbi:MAG: class II glutamine amidotransferase, partial [Pirellulaceae bacterium]|nr:class II glutamine amidotransferase [Pirellulaceae bacterium]
MAEIHHECGVAALYHLPGKPPSPLCPSDNLNDVSHLMPRMLLDIQNRGQLSAGMTSFKEGRNQLIDTYKELGTVSEVFRLSHKEKCKAILSEYSGNAAIGHVRYATCGKDDRSYAQPFERHHLIKHKWFSFAFNGNLANYKTLRKSLLSDGHHHLARDTDTEIFMHEISRELTAVKEPNLVDVFKNVSKKLDGAYNLVLLNACGEMIVVRDPLGMKPIC